MTDPHTALESVVEDLRLTLNIRKQEVARRAGVTPSYLRRVLIGRHTLSPDVEAGLARALEVPRERLRALVAAKEAAPPSAPPPGGRYTQAEWDRLDEADRQLLINIHRKVTDTQNHPSERRGRRGA